MGAISFYLDTRRAKKDGSFPVKLYVNHFKRFHISTSFSALESNWEINQYSRKEPNYKAKNISLRSMMNKAEDILYALEKQDRLKSTSDDRLKVLLEEAISGKINSSKGMFDYFEEFIATKQKKNTLEIYKGTLGKIKDFDYDCSFDSIDKRWLLAFDSYMSDKGLMTNSRSIHMRNLRTVFNYAIDSEITTNYPFRKFPIKKEETRKRSLTTAQLIRLRDYGCEEYQVKYRDMFMLMFYLIGINSIDLYQSANVINGRIEYRRAKTGRLYSIKVEPEAMVIIKKHEGKSYLLNVMDTYKYYKDFSSRMNDGLKKIGECERTGRGGKKHITPIFPDLSSYWARHTWATMAAGLDIPKETISAALGHEIGASVTSIYIRFDRRKIDEANRKVIDYLNKYKKLGKRKISKKNIVALGRKMR